MYPKTQIELSFLLWIMDGPPFSLKSKRIFILARLTGSGRFTVGYHIASYWVVLYAL